MSSATQSRVYRQRALRLARRPPAPAGERPSGWVLVVSAGGERCGIDLADVAQVTPPAILTPVPQGPPALAGAALLRGEPMLVWNLARLLGLPEQDEPCRHVVLLRQGRGLAVSRAEAIRAVADGLRVLDVSELFGKEQW